MRKDTYDKMQELLKEVDQLLAGRASNISPVRTLKCVHQLLTLLTDAHEYEARGIQDYGTGFVLPWEKEEE